MGDVGGQAGWSEARRDDANRTLSVHVFDGDKLL